MSTDGVLSRTEHSQELSVFAELCLRALFCQAHAEVHLCVFHLCVFHQRGPESILLNANLLHPLMVHPPLPTSQVSDPGAAGAGMFYRKPLQSHIVYST